MDEILLAATTATVSSERARTHTPSPLSTTPAATSTTLMAAPSRGRPKGWRPGMSYAEMRVNGIGTGTGTGRGASAAARPVTAAAARSARQIKVRGPPPGFTGWRRRGRPPKVPSPPPRELYRRLKTPFVAFLCEWAGCEAELHNLDTLRRHVYLVHHNRQTESGPSFTCQWGKCNSKEEATTSTPETFLDKERFLNHMEDVHFVPFSWHVGDGPRNRSQVAAAAATSQDEIPDYLKDAQGNQVTPSIKDQELEDQLTYRTNRQKLRELLDRMDENLPSEESDTPVDDEDE